MRKVGLLGRLKEAINHSSSVQMLLRRVVGVTGACQY